MTDQEVLYFGYGANAHPEMIEALIGRTPEGFRAVLRGHGLFVQSWLEIPLKARALLEKNWDKNFRSYIVTPLKDAVTWGMAWKLTKQERAIVGEWEMHEIWFQPIKVEIFDEQGENYLAETEVIDDFKITGLPIQERDYENFPFQKEKMLEIARLVRKEFLSNL